MSNKDLTNVITFVTFNIVDFLKFLNIELTIIAKVKKGFFRCLKIAILFKRFFKNCQLKKNLKKLSCLFFMIFCNFHDKLHFSLKMQHIIHDNVFFDWIWFKKKV